MQDDIDWFPYGESFKNMPSHYQKQFNQMELAVTPLFNLEHRFIHKPCVCPQQFQLSRETKKVMEDWIKLNIKSYKKSGMITHKSTTGKGYGDYADIWSATFHGDLLEVRGLISSQAWLQNERNENDDVGNADMSESMGVTGDVGNEADTAADVGNEVVVVAHNEAAVAAQNEAAVAVVVADKPRKKTKI